MIYKEMNRVPKAADTKLGGPSETLYVNWDAFRDKPEPEDEKGIEGSKQG